MKNKEFEELKQLDRIEYMLREKKLKIKFVTPSFIYFSFMISFIIIHFALLVYIAFGSETLFSFLEKVNIIYPVMKFGFVLFIILDIISVLLYFFNLKKLNKRFKQ